MDAVRLRAGAMRSYLSLGYLFYHRQSMLFPWPEVDSFNRMNLDKLWLSNMAKVEMIS
jgi:hypothetical protein